MSDTLVLGDWIVDRSVPVVDVGAAPERPGAAVVRVAGPESLAAGGAANVAANAAALGAEVAAFGRVGVYRDVLALLDGVVRCHHSRDYNYRNPFKTRYVAADGLRLRVDEEQAEPPPHDADCLLDGLRLELAAARAVCLVDYGKGFWHGPAIDQLTAVLGDRPPAAELVVDPGRHALRLLQTRPHYHTIKMNLAQAHHCLLTLAPSGTVAPLCQPHEGVIELLVLAQVLTRTLRHLAVFDFLLLTLGAGGVFVCDRDVCGWHHAPVVAGVKAVDVCGAGDTFLAAYAVALARRTGPADDWDRVCAWTEEANAAAALAVQKPGTAVVGRAELDHFLRHHRRPPSPEEDPPCPSPSPPASLPPGTPGASPGW